MVSGHNKDALVALVRQLESSQSAALALAEAARWTLVEEIERLLAAGVDPNETVDNGQTPLMRAGSNKSTQMLLKAGADAGAADGDGATPLIWFCRGLAHKKEAISRIELLLSHGADPTAVDREGKTALDYAAGKYDADVLNLLRAAEG